MTSLKSHPGARALLALCILLAALIYTAEPSGAHARLVASSPTSGSALTALPTEIDLEFSEPIVPSSLNLRLERDDGTIIQFGQTTIDENDHRVRVEIPQSPPQIGALQLVWSVRSASDGHESAGVISFTVGTGRPPVEIGSTGSGRDPVEQIVARAVWLLAMALICASFVALVALGPRPGYAITLLAGLVSLGASVVMGRPWVKGGFESQAARYLLCAGAAGLVAAAFLRGHSPVRFGIAAVFWIAALMSHSAAGHASGVDSSTVATAIASGHSIVALAWLGALAALVLNAESVRFRRALVIYSRIALVGAAAVVMTGLASIPFLLTGQRAISDSIYGRTILVKAALVVLVLAVAGANHLVVRPLLNISGSSGALRQARYTMAAELGALAVVVCLAATLSATSPAARQTITQVAAPVRNLSDAATAADLRVNISAAITGTTDDIISVTVNPATDGNAGEIQRVIVATSYRDPTTGAMVQGERFDARPTGSEPGAFEFSALRLSRQAVWSIDVTVRRSGLLDAVTTFAVDTTGWQAERPRVAEREWQWPIVANSGWALLLAAVVIPALGIVVVRRHGQVEPFSGAILMIALAMIATGFAIQAWQRTTPRTAGHELASPADPDLVSAASDYMTLCLACHGPDGAGIDTIDPVHQHGSGTNLVDSRSRQLSDGDLYLHITGGIGDTDMPAYDIALGDKQRWDLVAYLRELQADPPTPETTAGP